MEMTTTSPVKFSDSAIEEIRRLQAAPGADAAKWLRVGVKGGGCSGMTYILDFDLPTANDMELEYNGLRFIMDRSHEMYLYGMEVTWDDGLNSRGFTFKNPNASSTCGCGTSFAV